MPDLEEDDGDEADVPLEDPLVLEAKTIEAAIIVKMRNAVAVLMEHGCDSVQIVATSILQKNNGTIRVSSGGGNFFARLGAVRMWLSDHE